MGLTKNEGYLRCEYCGILLHESKYLEHLDLKHGISYGEKDVN